MQVKECKVNHMINPLGYKMEKTVFSWIVDGMEVEESRLKVWRGEKLIKDTGWGWLNNLAAPMELELKPRSCYLWQVQVRNVEGEMLASEVQRFETGKLGEAWRAWWITCNNEEKRLPIFQKEFVLSEVKEVASARLYICGLGLYEAYINGKKVGEEYMAPGCHSYNHYVQSRAYDVTELVSASEGRTVGKGAHRLSVLLGDGWYKGRFDFEKFSAPFYGEEYALIVELCVTYADGSEEVIITDENWSVERSNIVFSGIYDGEIVDDTLPKLPVERAGLLRKEMPPIEDRLSLPVTVHENFTPEIIHTPKGELVLDIGQNLAGIFRLRVHEKAGQKIHLQFGEVLQDGNFYRDNLRTAKAEYIYISDGEEHVLSPHFAFYGYRYVKVEGITDFRAEDFIALAIYSDLAQRGKIRTGNELVNQLISNTIWGMKSNFVDIPTDCPQRDERMGWTGDAQAFSETAGFLVDTYAFYRKYLYDMAKEQEAREGMVPDVVPAFRIKKGCSVWGDATCIIPWNMYVYSGDVSILEEHYESMVAWLAHIQKVDGDNHGWRSIFHYGDWLAMDFPCKGVSQTRGGTDEGFIADVYYRKSALITAKAAALLGKEEDAKFYNELAEKILQGIREEFFSITGRCCISTQTAALLTWKENLSDRVRAKKALRELLENNRNMLTTGFVGTPFLCETLVEQGMVEEAFKLLLNEEYPGWLYTVNLGATTIWERWNSLDETGHISSTGMNSLNHYTYGSITGWIWKDVAGLHVDEKVPGFKHVRIAPQVNWKLKFLESEYFSAAGIYEVSWKIEDINHLNVKIVVPNGCRATVELPLSDREPFEVSAGNYEYTYETSKEVVRIYSTGDRLKILMAEAEVRSLLQAEISDVEYLAGYAGEYPLRETLTNLGYTEEFISKLDELLREIY